MSGSGLAISRVAALSLSILLLGCGSGNSGQEVAESFASALDSEDWRAACALVVKADEDCGSSLADTFADREVRLLPAGGYLNGSEVTDNKTKFAVTTDKEDTAYFEIVDRGGRPSVDLQVVGAAFDGP